MIRVSLCMIVKNEESRLEQCLVSVCELVDEIIIVDTGSTDRTKELAQKFTEKLYDFEWVDDFSAARNFSYEQATMDYILWMDADEILLPQEAAKFRALKESLPPDVDAVMMRYNPGTDEQGRLLFSCSRGRLTKRACGFRWREPVHEYLEIEGKFLNSDISISHIKQQMVFSQGNIKIYESYLEKERTLSPRGLYYYARELKEQGRFLEAIEWFERFLDTDEGCVEDKIRACEELSKCYQAENKNQKSLIAMLRSFTFDSPRAETCCLIGYYYKGQEDFRKAVFWFDLALKLERSREDKGAHQGDFWGYIPSLECAVCHERLGNLEKAKHYNQLADLFKPGSLAVVHNRRNYESWEAGQGSRPIKF